MLDVMEELSMSSAVGMGSKEQVENFAMTTSPMIWALGFLGREQGAGPTVFMAQSSAVNHGAGLE